MDSNKMTYFHFLLPRLARVCFLLLTTTLPHSNPIPVSLSKSAQHNFV